MDTNTSTTDTGSASSLKYEKTQNRDVINTIERIIRSQQYKEASTKVVDAIGDAASEFASKEFRHQWRNIHESHSEPPKFAVGASVGSPVYKRHDDGRWYYTLTVSTSFTMKCTPLDGETEAEAKLRLSSWFNENIAPRLNGLVVADMNAKLSADGDTDGIVSFTLLQKSQEGDGGKIGKEASYGKVNLSYMSTLSFAIDDSIGDVCPYRDINLVREGLVSNMALAIERVRNGGSDEG